MFRTLHKKSLQQTLRMIFGHPRRPVQRVSRVGLRLRDLGQWQAQAPGCQRGLLRGQGCLCQIRDVHPVDDARGHGIRAEQVKTAIGSLIIAYLDLPNSRRQHIR